MQTYLRTLNLWNGGQIYFVERVSKIKHIFLVIRIQYMGLCFFRLTHFPCDDWGITHSFLIIIIKPEVWTIVHCLELCNETMVCAVCLSIFLSIWYLTGTSAVLLPVTFQRDQTILSTSQILQLRYFTRSYDKTFYRIMKNGPWSLANGKHIKLIYLSGWLESITRTWNVVFK